MYQAEPEEGQLERERLTMREEANHRTHELAVQYARDVLGIDRSSLEAFNHAWLEALTDMVADLLFLAEELGLNPDRIVERARDQMIEESAFVAGVVE